MPSVAKKTRAKVTQKKSAAGVVLTKEFPAGTILRPEEPLSDPQVLPRRPKVTCRWCGSDDVRETSRSNRKRYYRCGQCVDPATMEYTVFLVLLERP